MYLQAELNCMRDMLKLGADWLYYINMASQAFPLKTNAELVEILQMYNGANDIEMFKQINRWRSVVLIFVIGKI